MRWRRPRSLHKGNLCNTDTAMSSIHVNGEFCHRLKLRLSFTPSFLRCGLAPVRYKTDDAETDFYRPPSPINTQLRKAKNNHSKKGISWLQREKKSLLPEERNHSGEINDGMEAPITLLLGSSCPPSTARVLIEKTAHSNGQARTSHPGGGRGFASCM